MTAVAFQTYDFTLTAGGSQRIPVFGKYVRVQTSTGAVNLRGDFGVLKNLLPGQGQAINSFSWVIVEDASGAANSGSIIVGEEGFVDNRMILGSSSAIALDSPTQIALRTPFASNGNYKSTTILSANTADPVFLPGANLNGAILLNARAWANNGTTAPTLSLLSKASAPANPIDGEIYAIGIYMGSIWCGLTLDTPQFVPAGQGLYFIDTVTENNGFRSCRYKLL